MSQPFSSSSLRRSPSSARLPSPGPLPLSASDANDLIGASPSALVIDVRSFISFRKCHVIGAINIGLPPTLARRAPVTVAMMAATLGVADRARFDRRADADVIVYDGCSMALADNALLAAVVACLDAEGLVASTRWVVGGYDRFVAAFPDKIVRGPGIGLSREPADFAAAAAAMRTDAAINQQHMHKDIQQQQVVDASLTERPSTPYCSSPAHIAISPLLKSSPLHSPISSSSSSSLLLSSPLSPQSRAPPQPSDDSSLPKVRRVAPPSPLRRGPLPPLQLHSARLHGVLAASGHPRASPRSALPTLSAAPAAAPLSELLLPPVVAPPTRVLDDLYLGDVRFAMDLAALRRARIRFIVNATVECPNAFDGLAEFAYHRLPLRDTPSQQCQLAALLDTFVFMDAALASGRGRVLLHCAAGRSRSVTVAIAYLVYRFGLSVNDAYEFLEARRANICPNLGFMGILLALQPTLNAFPHMPIESATAQVDNAADIMVTPASIPLPPPQQYQRPTHARTSTTSEQSPPMRVRLASRSKAVSCPSAAAAAMAASEGIKAQTGQFVRSRSLSNSHLLMLHQSLAACPVDNVDA